MLQVLTSTKTTLARRKIVQRSILRRAKTFCSTLTKKRHSMTFLCDRPLGDEAFHRAKCFSTRKVHIRRAMFGKKAVKSWFGSRKLCDEPNLSTKGFLRDRPINGSCKGILSDGPTNASRKWFLRSGQICRENGFCTML